MAPSVATADPICLRRLNVELYEGSGCYSVVADSEDGSVRIKLGETTLVHWQATEWAEDQDVVFEIVHGVAMALARPREFSQIVLELSDDGERDNTTSQRKRR